MRKPNLVLSIFVSGLFPQGTAAKKRRNQGWIEGLMDRQATLFESK